MTDPKPDNLDQLEAAFRSGDKNRILTELKRYERQLMEAGSRTPMRSCPPPLSHLYQAGECLFCGKREP